MNIFFTMDNNMKDFIPSWTYKYELKKNRENYIKLINEVFDSGKLLFGNQLKDLENNFANYIGTNFSVGCDNATNGIFLALKTLGISRNDCVITVPNTAIPTVSAIRQAGAIPRFVDVNNFALMDAKKLENFIDEKVKAIIPVHLYGFPCDMEEIYKISIKNNIPIIEDCSQAHGAEINGRKVGSFGDLSVFSFYPTKPLGGYGDAGIICSNNLSYIEKIKKLRFYGIESNYIAEINGYNSRMDEIQAAIINYKLNNLEENLKKREIIADFYSTNIKSEIFRPIKRPENVKVSNYLIPYVFEGDRDDLQMRFKNEGIGTSINYRCPIYKMPAYRDLKNSMSDFPNTEKFCNSNISLPIFDYMPMHIAEEIVEVANKILQKL